MDGKSFTEEALQGYLKQMIEMNQNIVSLLMASQEVQTNTYELMKQSNKTLGDVKNALDNSNIYQKTIAYNSGEQVREQKLTNDQLKESNSLAQKTYMVTLGLNGEKKEVNFSDFSRASERGDFNHDGISNMLPEDRIAQGPRGQFDDLNGLGG